MTSDGDDLAVGAVLHGYRVLGRLGERSRTYEAESLDGQGRVALRRVLVRGALSPQQLERCEREARGLAQLSHRAIPGAFENFTEQTSEGTLIHRVESLLAGVSLERRVAERGPLTASELRRVAEELLGVLVYLHSRPQPVIHGDLAPSHVLLGADGQVSLVGFGARDLPRSSAGEASSGAGPRSFEAPEQLRGAAVPASDLYGLGATLVFALLGRAPGELPQRGSRVLWPEGAGVDGALLAWLSRLIEPSPDDRFPSAAAAHMALAELPRNLAPPVASPVGPLAASTAREPASSSRRTAILGGALVVVATGAAGLVLFADRLMPPPPAPPASSQPPAFSDEQREAMLLPAPPRPRHPAKLLRYEKAHVAVIRDLAVSSDGKRLATASNDGSVKLWSTETWTSLGVLGPHEGATGFVRFTSDGSVVTVDSKKVQLFDASSRARTAEAKLAFTSLSGAMARDGTFMVVGGNAGQVARFALPALSAQGQQSSPDKSAIYSLGLSTDGSAVAAGSKAGAVSLLPLSPGGKVPVVLPHAKTVDSIAFSPDGSTLATSGDDGVVRLSFASDGKELRTFKVDGEAWSLAFSADGSRLFVGDSGGGLRCFFTRSGELASFVPLQNRGVSALALSADGQRLFVGTGAGAFLAYDLDDPRDAERVPRPRTDLAPDKPAAAATLAERARAAVAAWPEDPDALDVGEKLASEALAANPRDALALTQRARIALRRAYRSGRTYGESGIAEARRLVAEALAADPRSVEALSASIHIELSAGRAKGADLAKALASAKALIKQLSAVPGAALHVEVHEAIVAREEGRLEEAEKLAAHVVSEATDRNLVRRAQGVLGEVYERSGRMVAKDQLYRLEIELDPGAAWLRGSYAAFLLRQGQHQRALEQIDAALALLPYRAGKKTRADILADRGVGRLWDERSVEPARADFLLALKDDPAQPDARYGLIAADYLELASAGLVCDDCASRLAALEKAAPQHEPTQKAVAMLRGKRQ